jgi:AcrR family transcriptional regulator
MPNPPIEDRRLQIMEAALPIFAEKGFKGATNRDIAQAAGIAPGLIYWYFKSKEDLFRAILEEFVPFGELTLPLATMTNVPPRQLLPLLAQGIVTIFDQPRTLLIFRILVAESMHAPDGGTLINTLIFKRIIDPLVIYITAQQAAGLLRQDDPLLMAQMFIASIAVFFIRRRVGEDPTLLTYDNQRVTTFAVDSFLRAFTPATE